MALTLDSEKFRYSQRMNPSVGSAAKGSPRGLTAVGIFLLFGAVMAFIAGTTLIWDGTSLDRIWVLNPRAYRQLMPFGKEVGIPFLLLSVALAAAAVGWFNRRLWGWRSAVAIIATQVLGDLANALMGDAVRGLVGLIVAGALLGSSGKSSFT
jgi:hypothetical protein